MLIALNFNFFKLFLRDTIISFKDNISFNIFYFTLKIIICLTQYSFYPSKFKLTILNIIDNSLKFIISNILVGGPNRIFITYLLFFMLNIAINIPNISSFILIGLNNNPYIYNFDLEIPCDYIKIHKELVSYSGDASSGTPSGIPGGTPGGMPGGSNESALLLSNNDQEDHNKDLKTRQRSSSVSLPSNKDTSYLKPISKDDTYLSETQVNTSLIPSFNFSISSVSHILSWLSGFTSLSSVDNQDLVNSSVSPPYSLNLEESNKSVISESSNPRITPLVRELFSSVRELLSSVELEREYNSLNNSGGLDNSLNNSEGLANSNATTVTTSSGDSIGSDMRNFLENTHWNEIIIEGINKRLENNNLLENCMYGTPVVPLNTTTCFTNEDLKPFPYAQFSLSGFRLPILHHVYYYNCESPFGMYNDVNYAYTSLIGRQYIVMPSYFYLDSNGESTFIELGRQYHIYPINDTRDVYNCMITYPNNTTMLIDNLITLRKDILLHRCNVLMTKNHREWLFTYPYDDLMEELLLRYISLNTNDFTSDLAPFINNVLYRNELD